MRLSAEVFQPEIPYDRKQRRRSSSKTLPPAQLSSSCARLWAALRRSPFVEHETLNKVLSLVTFLPTLRLPIIQNSFCVLLSRAHTQERVKAPGKEQ